MSKKKSVPAATDPNPPKTSLLDRLGLRDAYIFCGVLILLLLLVFYRAYVFEGLEPVGADIIKAIGQRHQIQEYSARTGETALWNPNIFCGIPTYHMQHSDAFHIDRLIVRLDSIFDWRVAWLLFSALGLFLLLRELRFKWYYALIGVVIFLFLPTFQGLFTVGHNAKIRAILTIPWVVLGFMVFIRKVDLFGLLLFVLGTSLQLRSKHYQIIFYTFLLLLAIGIWQLVVWLRGKDYKTLLRAGLMFVAGMGVVILMSAKPLFVSGDYTPYSTRGGKAIHLYETGQPTKTKGVPFDYATQWSLSPREMMTLIVPRFFGGTSQEPYTGKTYQQLKGQALPTYWGDMPFTQSSEYIGILSVVLAFIGVWFYRKNGFVIALSALGIFSILLAFGQFFPILYKTLFLYLPYFSKFRIPSMILNLIAFIIVILAVYGLKGLAEELSAKKFRAALLIAGFFAFLGLLFLLLPNLLSYSSAKDAQYASNPQAMEMLKTVRREFLQADTLRMLGLLAMFMTLMILYFKKIISSDMLMIGTAVLIAVDMIGISGRFAGRSTLVDLGNYENRYFQESAYDKLIRPDPEPYRVLELGALFQSNDLAYRHQIMGGYSAIKLQLIQDIIENNLYRRDNPQDPVNWNVVNMCNARYIISPGLLEYDGLTLLQSDERRRTILYKNDRALPRAYFVAGIHIFPDEKEVVRFLNEPAFDPAATALLSEAITIPDALDNSGTVEFVEYSPDRIRLKTNSTGAAFLVLSEAYYPSGWTALIDEQPAPIYQVNHLLRGILLPAGQHEIRFSFEPAVYRSASIIASVSTYLVWLLFIAVLILNHKDKFKKGHTAQK